jgi:hypothetical protein
VLHWHQWTRLFVVRAGSLVARFLFQPVEEICFSVFSSLVGTRHHSSASNIQLCAQVLSIVLKFMFLIGSIFVAFGTNYSALLLQLLYKGRYGPETGAPNVLAWYCVFVLLIGLNGMRRAKRCWLQVRPFVLTTVQTL